MTQNLLSMHWHYRTSWLIVGYCYVLFIIIASLIKAPDVNAIVNHSDKVIHYLIYFILVGWFVQLYKGLSHRLQILIAAISLGLVIEWLQGMTSYRQFDIIDALANSIGAGSAFLLSASRFDSILHSLDQRLYQLWH